MPTSIDSLQIDIIAQSHKADIAIDRLVSKLDKLSNSLGKIPVGSISGLASGVDKLGRAMQVMGSVDSRTFTRLANNINKLSQVNVASINTASSSIQRLSKSLNILGSTSSNAQGVVQLASALGRLGGKSVSNAIVNIPLLADAMKNLMVTLSKAPIVRKNVIDLANALANLAQNGKRVGTASRSITSGLNNTHKSMLKTRASATSLAATFGKLYANYFLIIRGAKAFVNAIKGTSDYIEAFNYYNVAFGKIASEWDKDWEKYGYDNAEVYAESFTKRMQESLSKMSGLEVVIDADGKGLLTSTNLQNLGLNIREITQYASQLASVTNSVGQTGEVSLAAARSFTKLGADISSLFNIDYSDAMANLQSGLIGQSRALYKYGIDITNATLQTYAFELGLSKSVSEMTQAEKMQLRMVAILDQSKVAWGDLANTINSPSNMLRQFTNNLREVGMVLGQLFIPLMERVMPVVNGATIAIKNFLVNLATLLGVNIDFSAFGQGFTDLGEDADELAGGLDSIASSAKKANAGLRKFDELNNINLPNASGGGGGFASSIDLTEEILKATEEYEKVWNEAFSKMEAKAQKFAEHIAEVFKPISEPLKRFFQQLSVGGWSQAGEAAGDVVSAIFDSATSALKNVDWDEIGRNIALFLKNIKWTEVISSAGNFLLEILNSAMDLVFGLMKESPMETLLLGGLISAGSMSRLLAKTKVAATVASNPMFKYGILIGKSIVYGIAASILGFNLGQKIYEWISDEKIELSFTEQFSKIRDSFTDGSWKNAFKLWGKDIKDGLVEIYDNATVVQTKLGTIVAEWLKKQTNNFTTFQQEAGAKFADWLKLQESSFSNWGYELGEKFRDFVGQIVEDAKTWLQELTDAINDFWGKTGNEQFRGNVGGIKFTPSYATGGFPEDGLFMANRGELVGQFSNGKTAVANNQQITQGIADAVYPAVYNAIVAGIGNSGIGGNSLRIEGDPRGMFRVFVDEWNNEARRTQNNPVIIYK